MWTNEQKNAIELQNKNILVSASAGSGKTAVLVERVINKVINYNVDIDKLLVVTFTNAAAAELKERLLAAIHEKLSNAPNDTFLLRQIELLGRASITTIHSFCLDIIRSNFQILNIDPNFKICDESKANILKIKAVDKILEDKYIDDNAKNTSLGLYKILELFSGKDENLVQEIFKIYSYIQSFDYPLEFLEKQIEKYNIDNSINLFDTEFGKDIFYDSLEEIKLILKRLKFARDTIENNEDFVKHIQMFDGYISSISCCIKEHENSWDKFYDLLNNILFSRAPLYKGANIELKDRIMSIRDIAKDTIKDIKRSIYAKSKEILNDNRTAYEYVKYLYDFIILFDNEYKLAKQKEGLVDFSDIEHLALNLLVNKTENGYELTDIADDIKKKFVEVYTDEYQDTSFVQEAILNAVSKINNRFMVGDIKQSIYKFRQAMPEIFNSKYDRYSIYDKNSDLEENDVKIILSKNFRSRDTVLASINYIFERVMSKKNGECDYSNLETLKYGADYEICNDNNYSTEINIIDLKENQEDTEDETTNYIDELKDFEIEAICIAKKIKELIGNFKVYNLKEKVFKEATYKDIVILVRSIKDKGRILENTFKKYNIAAFSDANSSLFDGDEIKLVLSFLKILDNIYSDTDLVCVMYSVIGNFTLDEIIKIRNYDKHTYVYNDILIAKENLDSKDSILFSKINNFLEVLNKFKKYSKIYNVSDLLIRIYNETPIYNQLALEEMANSKKANLDMLIEIATNYESDLNLGLSAYINYIKNIKNKVDNSTSSAKILGENEDVVRIMTIHKSKGLEYPIVILSDTTRKYNSKDTSSVITMHEKLGVGVNIVNDTLGITYPSLIKQVIRNKTIKEIKSEELRMLYVALTRAKEKLVIFSTVKDYEKLKSKMTAIYEDDKLDPSIVAKNNSYFMNILMALNDYDTSMNIFNINIEQIKKNISSADIENIFSSQLIDSNKKSIKDIIEDLSKNNVIDKKNVDVNLEKFKNTLDFVYPKLVDTNIPARVTVSELKREVIKFEEEAEEIMNADESIKFNIPKCLDVDNRYTAVRKGILVHFILENVDFKKINNKEEIVSYIDSLVLKKVISKNDKLNIDINKIFNFLNSKIGLELKTAKSIKKEEQFILNNKDISLSLIQGVIDLYYKNSKDEIILVDFKTDKLKIESEFINRYKKQLDIYKEAIEKLEFVKVSKVYIYSFELNKEIEVKYE